MSIVSLAPDWTGKDVQGFCVRWTNRAGAKRSVFFADGAKAYKCAAIKRKLGLACTVTPTTERLKFSTLKKAL